MGLILQIAGGEQDRILLGPQVYFGGDAGGLTPDEIALLESVV